MKEVIVQHGRERRVFAAEDMPLSIGGSASHVRMPGFDDEAPIAYLGHEHGDLFVQPEERRPSEISISCNGVPLTASSWLSDGDLLSIGPCRIRIQARGASVQLVIDSPAEQLQEATSPTVDARPPPSITAVSPTEFTPTWQSPPRRSGITVRPRAILLTLALIALATCAWYVLTARAVRVETDPPGAQLKVHGEPFAPKIGDRYLLRPGEYRVTASADGHMDLSATFEVGSETPPVVRFTLEPLGVILGIRARPVGEAAVTIDGALVGSTPIDGIQLSVGDHAVEVTAPRHHPFATEFRVEPGDPPLVIEADLEPNWAPVTVSSSPAGATVSVDRAAVGVTPLTAEVEAGDRLIALDLSGFKPFNRRVRIIARSPLDLGEIQLDPEDGQLMVISDPSGGAVMIDGEFRGTAPLEVSVSPNAPHAVRVSLAGHATYSAEVAVASGMRSEVRANLEVLTGEVVITSQPPGAELLIDGIRRGTTGQSLVLDLRPHEIEVRLEGYTPFRTVLTPEPGITQAVRAELRQAGPAGLVQRITSPQGTELVLVGPGRFTMGAPRREPGRRANEVLREVEITRPFYIAVREVSNEDFREFRSSHRSGGFGGQNLEIDHHPVVNVTWEDAARYCNWLSQKAGLPQVYVQQGGTFAPRSPMPLGYRLPTEAEWAWAARYPGTSTAQKYAWGNSLPVPQNGGNYGDRSAEGALKGAVPNYHDGYPGTAPVGSFQANPLGLYNLGGNVSEWVQDVYALIPTEPRSVERDPLGPRSGASHVIRGSSWMDTAVTELRLSYRDHGETARPDVGFRIARSAQ